jgi:hypothetical protein
VEGNVKKEARRRVDCTSECISDFKYSSISIIGEINRMDTVCGNPSRFNAVSMISSSQHAGASIMISEYDCLQHSS